MSDNIIPRVELLEDGRPADVDRMRRFIDLVRLGLNPLVVSASVGGSGMYYEHSLTPFTNPVAAFTTNLNFTTRGSVQNNSGDHQLVDSGPTTGNPAVIAQVKTVGSTFTMTGAFQLRSFPGADGRAGILIRNSTSGRMKAVGVTTEANTSFGISALVVDYASFTAQNGVPLQNPVWAARRDILMMRIKVTATQIKFQVAPDFVNWSTWYQENIAANYINGGGGSIDQAGFYTDWIGGGISGESSLGCAVYHAAVT